MLATLDVIYGLLEVGRKVRNGLSLYFLWEERAWHDVTLIFPLESLPIPDLVKAISERGLTR